MIKILPKTKIFCFFITDCHSGQVCDTFLQKISPEQFKASARNFGGHVNLWTPKRHESTIYRNLKFLF